MGTAGAEQSIAMGDPASLQPYVDPVRTQASVQVKRWICPRLVTIIAQKNPRSHGLGSST